MQQRTSTSVLTRWLSRFESARSLSMTSHVCKAASPNRSLRISMMRIWRGRESWVVSGQSPVDKSDKGVWTDLLLEIVVSDS